MPDITLEQQKKIEYFRNHGIPWLLEHGRYRNVGLSVFLALQAGLVAAWAPANQPLPIAVFGMIACVCFWLWDTRNHYIFGALHELGRELVDCVVFGVDARGDPKQGVHKLFSRTQKESSTLNLLRHPKKTLFSHTSAIRILLFSSGIMWLALLIFSILSSNQ